MFWKCVEMRDNSLPNRIWSAKVVVNRGRGRLRLIDFIRNDIDVCVISFGDPAISYRVA